MNSDRFLQRVQFALASTLVLLAPWLFGAWEMWWFWGFTLALFLSVAAFSFRLLGDDEILVDAEISRPRQLWCILAGAAPMVLYALIRLFQADVFMTAERSVLLLLTPLLLGGTLIIGASAAQMRLLFKMVYVDLLLLGAYGLINHAINQSRYVLWRPGEAQWIAEVRATGSYYCPDHFAGIMEFLLCMALGLLLSRRSRWGYRLAGILGAGVGIAGVVLSKSRGGGATLVVILLAALVLGFLQWRPRVRWALRGALALIAGALVAAVVLIPNPYMERMKAFPWERIEISARHRMITGALRAWQEAPIFGIGPGMHMHMWFHHAASPDGDREAGTWPTYPNYHFHSYEVHSDWVQLLEEYGVAGFIFFLVMCGGLLVPLLAFYRREQRRLHEAAWSRDAAGDVAPLIAALLAAAAMAFHSLGDFNLQMPATVWLLAVIVSIPLAQALREDDV